MFSTMTMASSTTKPVAMVSAISVRLLIEKPARYITPKVPTSDSGTTTLGMIVAGDVAQEHEGDQRRRGHGEHQLVLDVATEARIVSVRSLRTATSSVDGQAGGELRQQLP